MTVETSGESKGDRNQQNGEWRSQTTYSLCQPCLNPGLENKVKQGSRWTGLQSMAIITTPHASERSTLRSEAQDHPITAPSEISLASGNFASLALADSATDVAESDLLALTPDHRHLEIATPLGGLPKRAVDVAIALAAIILLCPLMLAIMGLIK